MSRAKVTNARRKQRVRLSLRRSAGGRPRLSVFRSSKHIYAQVIDDQKGETLASASSMEKEMRTRCLRRAFVTFNCDMTGSVTSSCLPCGR